MKKIFTFFCAGLMAVSAQAQLEITDDKGNVIEDGATVTFHAEEVDWSEWDLGVQVTCEPNAPIFKNTGSSNASLTVTVEKVTGTESLTWCGITDVCAPMNGVKETRTNTLEAGAVKGLALHASFSYQNYKEQTAKVTATMGGTTSTFFVKFVYNENSGVQSVEGNHNSVQYTGKGLSYNLTSSAPGILNIYGADGRHIASERISGNGIYSLSQLPQGIYLYEVSAQGKRLTQGKVLVK